MAKCNTRKKHTPTEEILRREITINQALIDLLIAKQVITEEELVSSIQKIRLDQQKLLNNSNKILPIKS
jgi:hypothetical protein